MYHRSILSKEVCLVLYTVVLFNVDQCFTSHSFVGETAESKAYKGKRVNIGYRYNLFDHIGKISTLRSEKSGSFPGCYDELLEPTVFQVEAFSPHQCPKDDIWPCPSQKVDETRIHWGLLKKTKR